MKLPKIVQVDWIDACSYSQRGWMDKESASEFTPYKVTSVGYLLRDDEHAVILSLNLDEGGKTSVLMDIPRAYVKKIKTLRKAQKK
jgi:hypothetical protein